MSKILIEREVLEHALGFVHCDGWSKVRDATIDAINAALTQASEPDQVDMRGVCEALGFDPTNHHNAAKCPYCRPAQDSQPVALPTEASEEANKAIRSMLLEYNYPANPQNAGRAGWRAARLYTSPQPESGELLQDIASFIGVGGYNGATTEQLTERIKDEFQRLTKPQPSESEAVKLLKKIYSSHWTMFNYEIAEVLSKVQPVPPETGPE